MFEQLNCFVLSKKAHPGIPSNTIFPSSLEISKSHAISVKEPRSYLPLQGAHSLPLKGITDSLSIFSPIPFLQIFPCPLLCLVNSLVPSSCSFLFPLQLKFLSPQLLLSLLFPPRLLSTLLVDSLPKQVRNYSVFSTIPLNTLLYFLCPSLLFFTTPFYLPRHSLFRFPFCSSPCLSVFLHLHRFFFKSRFCFPVFIHKTGKD